MIAEIKKPKVSVLMPVFNGVPFLKDAIESILSQSFSDFEFIVVDDGSTDGTMELLNEYAKKDKRIRILQNEKNMGIVFSLNRGLQQCSGEYIVRADADDISLKDRIAKQVAMMDSDSSICASGTALSHIDALGRELGGVRHCALGNPNLVETPLFHPTVIIRRVSLTRHKIYYKEKYRFAECYFLWLQLGKLGKISAINDVLVKYRVSKNATKAQKTKQTLWATMKVKKDAIFVLKITPTIKDIFRIFLELVLLLLPGRIVLFMYLRKNLGKGIKVNL